MSACKQNADQRADQLANNADRKCLHADKMLTKNTNADQHADKSARMLKMTNKMLTKVLTTSHYADNADQNANKQIASEQHAKTEAITTYALARTNGQ